MPIDTKRKLLIFALQLEQRIGWFIKNVKALKQKIQDLKSNDYNHLIK